jgi:hypothetical protein
VIDTEVEADFVLTLTGKLFAVIGGDIIWYTTFAYHAFPKHSCSLWGINVLSAEEVCHHFS